jgi:uncharacterized membrane protein YfcA
VLHPPGSDRAQAMISDVLILGGILAAAVAFLAGTSGFGFGLVATPALLLCGYSLPFAVTAVLLLSLTTRVSVAWRLRHAVGRRRVVLLVGGAAPGLWIGSRTLGAVDAHVLRIVVGAIVALSAAGLTWIDRHPPKPRFRGLVPAAGFLGGLLGTTTSLTGVPPALLLTRRRVGAEQLLADLSVYFIATAAIGLAVLAIDGNFSRSAAGSLLWWLPGVLVANAVGTTVGLRLPAHALRRLTLGLAFVAGIVTLATA